MSILPTAAWGRHHSKGTSGAITVTRTVHAHGWRDSRRRNHFFLLVYPFNLLQKCLYSATHERQSGKRDENCRTVFPAWSRPTIRMFTSGLANIHSQNPEMSENCSGERRGYVGNLAGIGANSDASKVLTMLTARQAGELCVVVFVCIRCCSAQRRAHIVLFMTLLCAAVGICTRRGLAMPAFSKFSVSALASLPFAPRLRHCRRLASIACHDPHASVIYSAETLRFWSTWSRMGINSAGPQRRCAMRLESPRPPALQPPMVRALHAM